jgi:hypothetical protein
MKWPYTNTGSFSVLLPLHSEWVENNTGLPPPPSSQKLYFHENVKTGHICEWQNWVLRSWPENTNYWSQVPNRETTWKLSRSEQDNIKMYITERVGLLMSFIIGCGVEFSTSKSGNVAIRWATIGSWITLLHAMYSNKPRNCQTFWLFKNKIKFLYYTNCTNRSINWNNHKKI